MAKSDYLENAILELLLNAQPIPNIADNAASAPRTDLYVSLHTADPTDAGNQSSNEVSYVGYARVAVNRTGTGWTVTQNSASPNADIEFPTVTSGSGTVTHVGIGEEASIAGNLLYHGVLSPSVVIAAGPGPTITAGSTITED